MTTPTSPDGDAIVDLIVDLTVPEPAEPPSVDEVLAWLRRPGGNLQDRTMRARAADLIEAARPAPPARMDDPVPHGGGAPMAPTD